jgi:hypothetical protein
MRETGLQPSFSVLSFLACGIEATLASIWEAFSHLFPAVCGFCVTSSLSEGNNYLMKLSRLEISKSNFFNHCKTTKVIFHIGGGFR